MVDKANQGELDAQLAEDNAKVQALIDCQARGEDPFSGKPSEGRSTIGWIAGNRETWILQWIAELEGHFQATGNGYFVLAAYDAALYLRDRAAHNLAWVDVHLAVMIKYFFAGNDPLRFGRGERSSRAQALKTIRDGRLAIEVMKQLPIEAGKETLAIAHVAKAEKRSATVVGDAWREFKKRRRQD
jgi:hypothetical protein